MLKIINEDVSSEEYEKQFKDAANHPTFKKMRKLCADHGYVLEYAFLKKFSEDGKGYPNIRISKESKDNKYLPRIFAPNRVEGVQWKVDTTSYGSLDSTNMTQLATAYKSAAELVEELEKIDLNDLPVIVDED